MKMLSQPKSAAPQDTVRLIEHALVSGDLQSATAVYPVAQGSQKSQLEALICAERRQVLQLTRWEHSPAAVLQLLAGIEDDSVRLRLDKNPASGAKTLNTLYQNVDHDRQLISLLAQHPHCPASLLSRLADEEDDLPILKAVASHANSDSETLVKLEQRYPEMFDSQLAVHIATPLQLLEVLYRRGNSYVRSAVVAHRNCPKPIFDEAIQESDCTVLRHLAGNVALSRAMLTNLAEHADASVRRAVAGNAATSSVLANRMIADPANSVRRAVAARNDLTIASLQYLSSDIDHWVRQWVARNPALPEALLRQLAADKDDEVRRAVGRNSATPAMLLKLLAHDLSAWVRAGVAYQVNTPATLLGAMADEEDVDVLSGVASNSNTPQRVLQRLAASQQTDIRRGVILNPSAERDTLLPLLEDPYYLHRLLLVSNEVLTDDDRWSLHDDPDPSVRFTVFSWFARKKLQVDLH